MRDALAHLYDPAHLQTHPLAALLAGLDAGGRGRRLGRALADAVDALTPPRDASPKTRRVHTLLKRRYLDALAPEDVQRELLIGRSEYYRAHQQALEAVASLLTERLAPTHSPESPAGRPPAPTNLPLELTSFVGREAELAELRSLLGATRLLTLTGAGGCGKTRLALRLAAESSDQFRDGVWLVELARVTDPARVAGAVANAVGVRETPSEPPLRTLATALRSKRMLLVLDNCEPVVAACAQLAAALLESCPDLRVLATSREPLRVGGEVAWRVPPLPTPPEGETPERLGPYAALRLFVERAAAALPGFLLDEENAPAVARICRRLDGMPLAIELAAVRVSALPPQEIAERLEDRFRLLTGGSRTAPTHHQTLRATLEWSHDRLTPAEQALFRRLAVFAGGWTLDAAEAICGEWATTAPRPLAGSPTRPLGDGPRGEDVLGLLAMLVDKSLVVADQTRGGGARYRLLETIGAYALERLGEHGEADAVGARRTAFFLAMAERAEDELLGPGAPAWIDRLEREHDNMRAALRWSLARGEDELALRLVGALGMFWHVRGHVVEGRGWLEAALALGDASRASVARARALYWAGWHSSDEEEGARARGLCAESLAMARAAGDERTAGRALGALGELETHRREADLAAARAMLGESLAIGRRLRDEWGLGWALHCLGGAARQAGDTPAACAAYAENLARARAAGDRWMTAVSLEWLGHLALEEDDPMAGARYEASLAAYRELGERWGEAHALQGLGLAALARGDADAARAWLGECLAMQRELVDALWFPRTLEGFAALALLDGRSERAARLFGAAEAARDALGYRTPMVARASRDRDAAAARAALGDAAFATAFAEGKTMTREQALQEIPTSSRIPSASDAPPR